MLTTTLKRFVVLLSRFLSVQYNCPSTIALGARSVGLLLASRPMLWALCNSRPDDSNVLWKHTGARHLWKLLDGAGQGKIQPDQTRQNQGTFHKLYRPEKIVPCVTGPNIDRKSCLCPPLESNGLSDFYQLHSLKGPLQSAGQYKSVSFIQKNAKAIPASIIEETGKRFDGGSEDFEATRVFAAGGPMLVGGLNAGGNRVWCAKPPWMVL